MLSQEYWKELCPELTIASAGVKRPEAKVSEAKFAQEKNRLDYDGHFIFEEIMPDWATENLKNSILKLHAMGLPAIFISLFDEFWELVAALQPVGRELLNDDYMIYPDFWVWHIDHQKPQAGWRPHRETTVNVPDPNYGTDSISLWVALSEATTENGCVYILPKSKDKGYPHTLKFDIMTLQHVKGLPVKAGSVIGWNQSVFHWGASNSREATHARISFAMELRPVSKHTQIPFMMKAGYVPSFDERLQLVAMQFINYRHLHGHGENSDFMQFARNLLGPDYVPR